MTKQIFFVFSFYFLLQERAKPILPPYLLPLPPRTMSLWLNRVKDSIKHPSTHSLNPPFCKQARAFRVTYERQSVLNCFPMSIKAIGH